MTILLTIFAAACLFAALFLIAAFALAALADADELKRQVNSPFGLGKSFDQTSRLL